MEKIFETSEGMKVVGTTVNGEGNLVVTYENKMTAREFVESCFDGCVVRRDKEVDSVVYGKDGKWYFELKKYDDGWILWCSYYRVRSILTDQYRMKYADIQALIQDVVTHTYNMGLVTPSAACNLRDLEVTHTYNFD